MVDLDDMRATVEAVERALGALPGREAQHRMSPIPRRGDDGTIPREARPGATMLLLFPQDGAPHLVLTKRSRQVEHHKGQISLPGGRVEAGESPEQAALREAHEEIGVEPDTVTVLGPLSPLYIPVSGFVMHPYVGTLARAATWRLQESEVEAVMTPPLRSLADPSNHLTYKKELLGEDRDVPYFSVRGERVWGATAMVLAEFMHLLGVSPEPGGTP